MCITNLINNTLMALISMIFYYTINYNTHCYMGLLNKIIQLQHNTISMVHSENHTRNTQT